MLIKKNKAQPPMKAIISGRRCSRSACMSSLSGTARQRSPASGPPGAEPGAFPGAFPGTFPGAV